MIKDFKTGQEYLQAIYNQHRRYLSVQRELAECKAHIYQIKGQRYEKDKVSGGIQPDLSDRVILVEKYEEMVVQEHEELIIMRIEARRLIDMIKNDDEKTILRELYLNHRSYRAISRTIRISRNNITKTKEAAEASFEIVFQRLKRKIYTGNK